ncbi:SymE family type I addiction module toxin [Pantoea sp. Z09]|uniref:SymE family type I addiction module toxin n=1 Tax=Pantoea sp. Z09 TaxID=2886821 RepID=UPI003530037B
MAKQDIKPEGCISKALGLLKVGYTSIRHADRNDITTYYSRCPSINLKGSRLTEAGLTTGKQIKVTVEPGRLIICTGEGNWLVLKVKSRSSSRDSCLFNGRCYIFVKDMNIFNIAFRIDPFFPVGNNPFCT